MVCTRAHASMDTFDQLVRMAASRRRARECPDHRPGMRINLHFQVTDRTTSVGNRYAYYMNG